MFNSDQIVEPALEHIFHCQTKGMKCLIPDGFWRIFFCPKKRMKCLISHGHPAPSLFKLPQELLILIASFVCDREITSFRTPFLELSALSKVNKRLYVVCMMAGLYWRIWPTCKQFKRSVALTHPSFGSNAQSVRSLGIDLDNTEAWPLCLMVMEIFPDLDELCFTGMKMLEGRTVRFFGSNLATKITQFKGTSLVFRKTSLRAELLKLIPRHNITSLCFNESQLPSHEQYWATVPKPIFPNLKKVKFVGDTISKYWFLKETASMFKKLFLDGSQLTHFEISYGIAEPLSLTVGGEDWENIPMDFGYFDENRIQASLLDKLTRI